MEVAAALGVLCTRNFATTFFLLTANWNVWLSKAQIRGVFRKNFQRRQVGIGDCVQIGSCRLSGRATVCFSIDVRKLAENPFEDFFFFVEVGALHMQLFRLESWLQRRGLLGGNIVPSDGSVMAIH